MNTSMIRTANDGGVLMVQLPADLLALVMTGATLYALLTDPQETENVPPPDAWHEGQAILRGYGGGAALTAAIVVLTNAMTEGGYGR